MAVITVGPALLEELKLDQGVTWSDAATDSSFRSRAADGMMRINELLGESGDYSVPGDARMLLFEYVRYARAGALDVWENNYSRSIVAAQTKRRIARYAEENAVSSGG